MVAFVIALLLYTISLISLLSVLTYTKCSFSRGGFTYPAFFSKMVSFKQFRVYILFGVLAIIVGLFSRPDAAFLFLMLFAGGGVVFTFAELFLIK